MRYSSYFHAGSSLTYSNVSFWWINLTDVALAHILAYKVCSANGRYCMVERVSHNSGIVNIILPLSQNKCRNFVLTVVQSCTKFETLILERREYMKCIPTFQCQTRKFFLKGPDKQSQHSLRAFSQVKSLGIKSRTTVLDITYFTYFLVWFLLRLQVQGLGHNKCYILMSCLNTIESA